VKQKEKIQVIAEIGILSAIAVILDFLFGLIPVFPWGGSISPAMLPIFVIAYRHGVKAGLLSGFAFAILQIIVMLAVGQVFPEVNLLAAAAGADTFGPTWLKVVMVILLDYLIPFTLLGFAGLFKNALSNVKAFVLGMVVASFFRYIMHGLSGVLVWGSYTAWFNEEFHTNVSPFVYSFLIYNLTYMVGSLVFCIFVGLVLFKRNLLTVNLNQKG